MREDVNVNGSIVVSNNDFIIDVNHPYGKDLKVLLTVNGKEFTIPCEYVCVSGEAIFNILDES